jgi:cell division protein FtsW
MPALSRADTSLLGRWWWTIDRWTLVAVAMLIGFGYIMMLAASPAVAERIRVPRDVFLLKQVFFLIVGGAIVIFISLLSPRGVRRVALAGCVIALLLTALTLARRSRARAAGFPCRASPCSRANS